YCFYLILFLCLYFLFFFFLWFLLPPRSTLFPYTTLFRSLKWEESEMFNIGFESRLFKNFGFDFEWFYRYTYDIIEGIGGLYPARSEEHTSELQSRENLVCRLLLEKKKIKDNLNNKIVKS